jgi:hypothetical protein
MTSRTIEWVQPFFASSNLLTALRPTPNSTLQSCHLNRIAHLPVQLTLPILFLQGSQSFSLLVETSWTYIPKNFPVPYNRILSLFHEPISLSATIKVWRKRDIEDWIDSFSSKGTSDGVA